MATPSPSPTATSTPGPTPTPTPEPVLYEADSSGGFEEWGNLSGWTVLDSELISDGSNCTTLVAPVDLSDVRDYAVEAEIQGITAMEDTFGFGVFARWNGGERYWGGYRGEYPAQFMIALGTEVPSYWGSAPIAGNGDVALDNEWHTYRLAVEKNRSRLYIDGSEVTRAVDNRLLSAGDAGIWCNGAIQLAIRSFKIVPLGDSATSAESGRGEEPEESAALELADMLLTEDEVPEGLVQAGEGALSIEEITDSYPDSADALRRFTEWGWQENAYRSFAPDGAIQPGGVISLQVNLHRFRSEADAGAALPYLADARADVMGGLQEIPVPPIGDQVEARVGPVGDGQEASLFVLLDNVTARVSAVVSNGGDPLVIAQAAAEVVVANAG